MAHAHEDAPGRTCPRTGRPLAPRRPWWRRRRLIWLYPLAGLLSLVWFLVRVVPKPSRAAYPCQQAAAPLAASFVVWVAGVLTSIVAFHRARAWLRRSRYVVAGLAVAVGIVGAYFALTNTPSQAARAAIDPRSTVKPANQPLGAAKGIFPGRVVWAHDPDATTWDGSGYWWREGFTDRAVTDRMMADSLCALAGQPTTPLAWDALFRHFNQTHGRGNAGYQPGEKIAIKINLTVCNVDNNWTDSDGNQIANFQYNSITVELVASLLDQLVNVAGVPQDCIFIGDPTCHFPNREFNYLSADFPDVHYMTGRDGRNLPGREKTASSPVEFHWSTPDADGYLQDYLPRYYAEAAYFINFAILKAHGAGVTLCGKNHYGSLNRRPPTAGYYDMHDDLCYMNPAMGSYRTLVDLLGHEHIGGKTLLCLLDGIWGGYGWGGICPPQKWRMSPFDNDYPNSLFISQDPIAIDSVGFDFWYEEDRVSWYQYPFTDADRHRNEHLPHLVATEDYLHEGALADDPPSGTFYDPENDGVRMASLGVHEHWNNGDDKQYSRNLGIGEGIELFLAGPPPAAMIGQHVFYNNSVWDGYDPAANAADDGAVAPDKVALHAGQTATFDNCTGYAAGLNGVMIDIANLPAAFTAEDILCSVGDGAAWAPVPLEPAIAVRFGEGAFRSDRITLTWPDGTIVGQWLRVVVVANERTGLADPAAFWFGNAPGETGDVDADATVTASDAAGCSVHVAGLDLDDFATLKNNFGRADGGVTFALGDYDIDGDVDLDDFVVLKRNFGTLAAPDNPCDHNRDGRVNAADWTIVMTHLTGPGTALPLITAP
ncbi:MAG: DUF362 domain-containing protein [Planctomycetes bacterium]|nr:DUF362 domain-containing protein [Planctomycetota bacterium]